MKINGTLSISFRHDCVSIRIHDETSRIGFVDAEISHEEFSRALSSLQGRPLLECEVRGLEYLGMTRVNEYRSIECPLSTYDKTLLSAWLAENAQEEGWILSTYLGSQGSVTHRNDKTVLNYTVTKYVKQEEQA